MSKDFAYAKLQNIEGEDVYIKFVKRNKIYY